MKKEKGDQKEEGNSTWRTQRSWKQPHLGPLGTARLHPFPGSLEPYVEISTLRDKPCFYDRGITVKE